MSQISNFTIDEDTDEFLCMITDLKNSNKEKFIETKGLIKGILLSELKLDNNRLNLKKGVWFILISHLKER